MPYQQRGIAPPPLEMVNQSPMAMMQKIIMGKIQERKEAEARQYAEEQQKKEWAQREREIDLANKNVISKIKLEADMKAALEKAKLLKRTQIANAVTEAAKIQDPRERQIAMSKALLSGDITPPAQMLGSVGGIPQENQRRAQENMKVQSGLIEDRATNQRALVESRIKNAMNIIKNDPYKSDEQKRYEMSQMKSKLASGSFMPNMGLSPSDRNTVELNRLAQEQKEMSLKANTLKLSNDIQKLLDDVMPGTPKETSLQLAGWLINVPPDQFATELAKVIHKEPGMISQKWEALKNQIPQGITNLFDRSTPNLGEMPENDNASYLENELKKRNKNKQ